MKKAALFVFISVTLFFGAFSPAFAVDAPQLQSPPSSSSLDNPSPTLSWIWSGTCTSVGSCYHIQVDESADFSSPFRDFYTSNSSYKPQLIPGPWFWRVKAKDSSNSWSTWSEVWSFTINQAYPHTLPEPGVDPQVSLSEFMPNPGSGDEWVEIYNIGSSEADLTGWKLDDASGFSSPTTLKDGLIAPGSYKVFSFSSKLNNDGDSLRLLRPDGSEFEVINFGKTTRDVSFAKAFGSWQQTTTPTPGSANQISSGKTLAATDQKPESNSASSPSFHLDMVKDLVATPSSSSERPISTKPPEIPKVASKIFLPVIVVGAGILLLITSGIIFLKKTSFWKRKKEKVSST